MRDYRKYKVWELGHEITLNVYKSTQNFPKQEIYGIVSQMRRAAYSIPSNITEGCKRESDAEFRRFPIISQGSVNELEYFTVLTKDLGYLEQQVFAELNDKVDKIRRSLNNLINKI
ncbi:four helix bundle protein [Zobellia alginiliquefaciens]|uniref:four helix bundle protein n=1 Tax=Zobellia alginiliquefaciens TaxID=3032586 RepID=UPI0023E3F587|nr:four helix bundle protein [Zobellia alginiliquefaciens]